jgi:hypothetical protein
MRTLPITTLALLMACGSPALGQGEANGIIAVSGTNNVTPALWIIDTKSSPFKVLYCQLQEIASGANKGLTEPECVPASLPAAKQGK